MNVAAIMYLMTFIKKFKSFKYIEQRVKNHCSDYENINSVLYNRLLYKTIRENGEWNKWRLEKIENFPCNNGIEAREREQ